MVRKSLRWSLLGVAVAIAAIILGIVPFNAGFVRGFVETAVRDNTGLDLEVSGPIKVRLGPWPSVTTGGLAVGDAAHDPLLIVDSLRTKIGLTALFRGRIHVLELQAHGIAVDYCSPFPEFPDSETGNDPLPSVAVDEVVITEISVRCGPSPGTDPLELTFEQVLASAPQGAAVQANAAGSISGLTFDLTLTGGELNDLIAGTEPYPVTATLSSDSVTVEASGHLDTSSESPSVDADVAIREGDVRALAGNFDIELPDLGVLGARGRLRGDLGTLELAGFAGDLGSSSFDFDSTVDMSGDRLHAKVAATLAALDLAPFLDDESATQQLDDDIDFSNALENLDALDAELQLTVHEVLGAPIPVRSAELRGQVTNGIVTLESLEANMLGGQLSADGSLDSKADCPALQLRVRAAGLDLATLNPLLPIDRTLGGAVDSASLESSSCGQTLLAHRKSLRADAEFIDADARLGDELLPLSTKRLHVSIRPDERSRLHLVGVLADEEIDASLAAGSLEALLGPDSWPLDLDARGGGGHLQVNGRARLVPEQPLVDAELQFDAPSIGALHAWTGSAPAANLPLHATTRLRLDDSQFVAEDVAISLGESDIGGRMAWNYAQDPALLAVTIRSDSIDLSKIAATFPPAAEQEASINNASRDDSADSPVPFTLPPVDLDLTLDAIHADRLDLQDFRLSGRLRRGLIEEARIGVVVEDEIRLQGGLDVDLRQQRARAKAEFSAENLDIGRVLRRADVAEDLRLRADTLELLVTANGVTTRELLLNTLLQIDLQGLDWNIPKPGSETGTGTEDTLDLALGQIQLTMTPDEPTTWSSKGSVGDVDVELWMQTPSLNEIFSDSAELPITMVAAAGSDVLMVDASIDRSERERLNARVTLSGEVIDSRNRTLSGLASPLGDYQLESDIVLSESRLQLPNATMRLGSSSAGGRFDIDASGPRARFDIALNASHLQTDDLLYWSRDFREAMVETETLDDDEANPEEIDADAADVAGQRSGVLYLASDFLDQFREDNDLDLSITVDELVAGPDRLGKSELRLYVDADDFFLKPVTITLPYGGVNAEYTASTRNGLLDAGLKINADALSYGGLLRLADPESEARGFLYVDLDISANTEVPPGAVPFELLFDKANGSVDVASWPENIEAGVLDLWSANLVLALVPRSETGERSRLNCVVSRFDIEDGLMKSRTSLLDTTDTIIRGRGTINLPQEELDLLVWPQAKREKFLSVATPITVTGSFSDFAIGVEPAGIIGTLIKWYTSLIYVPYKLLTGERFPPDGTPTCFDAMDWELTPELHEYFLQRDFSAPP